MEFASSLNAEFSAIIREYEKSKSITTAEKEGIFYTPHKLAHKIALDCLTPYLKNAIYEELLQIKILDPSCGSGVFLIACFEILLRKLTELNLNCPEKRVETLKSCIFGLDKDSQALSIAGKLLKRICGVEDISLENNLITANSLFSLTQFDPEIEEDRLFLKESCIIPWEKLLPEKFTLVIGNPPYGISRDEKLSPLENKKLKSVFSAYKLGKVNKYLAFMAKGFEVLMNEGTLSYVVPNAWLGIQAGKKLRALFNSEGSFESFEFFEKPIFNGIEVETIVFRYKKSAEVRSMELIHYEDAENFKIVRKDSYQKKLCNFSNEFIIPTKWDEKMDCLRSHLSETCMGLESENSPFESLIALQAYSTGKGTPPQTAADVKNHSFHSNFRNSENHFPYLEGKDIGRYMLNWSGRYLHYGSHLAEPQILSRFLGTRLLLREILSSFPYVLTVALVKEAYLYNKSVLHIISKEECDEEDFYALLAILNSSFAGYFIKNFGRKSQRKLFPKIVNADLKTFPLPRDFKSLRASLSDVAREISRMAARREKTENLQKELDRTVLKAYKIAESSISIYNT
jgi:hypothetical protein